MAHLLTQWPDPGETEHHAVRHLLGLCAHCEKTAEEMRRITSEFGHWNLTYALTESAAAPELWRRLEALPFPEQLAAVVGDGTYQTWGLCRLLQRLSGEAAARLPPEGKRAADLANLAVEISCRLESTYDVDWIEDLQGRSYAKLGDARRLLDELHGAGDAFGLARQCLLAGTGYPSVEAEVAALEALLRRDERRLVTAAELFERVQRLHTDPEWTIADPDAANPHLAGSALLHRAWCVFHLGQTGEAAGLIERAAELIDEKREPRLGLALRHGRVWAAIALDNFAAAETLLAQATVMVDEVGDDGVRLRLRRAAARIAAGAGEADAAKQTLRETATAAAAIGQGVDAALALIDLAVLCLRTEDREGLEPLAGELLIAFQSDEVQREEMAALLLLQQAIEQDLLTIGLAESLASMLERHRAPSLDWWSGWGTVLSRERTDNAKRQSV
jgi:tetratricopeptide (TPR) repeat protein